MTSTAFRPGESVTAQQSAETADLVAAVRRVAAVSPGRTVVRYHYRALTYRDLAAALDLMVPVTRSQHMDDRAAVVAAVFAGMPALSAERDPASVAAVIDGTFARVLADLAVVTEAAPARGATTTEIDLREIAGRLPGA